MFFALCKKTFRMLFLTTRYVRKGIPAPFCKKHSDCFSHAKAFRTHFAWIQGKPEKHSDCFLHFAKKHYDCFLQSAKSIPIAFCNMQKHSHCFLQAAKSIKNAFCMQKAFRLLFATIFQNTGKAFTMLFTGWMQKAFPMLFSNQGFLDNRPREKSIFTLQRKAF